ncbi:hypothetical protein D3C74_302260 [compost metagenome]
MWDEPVPTTVNVISTQASLGVSAMSTWGAWDFTETPAVPLPVKRVIDPVSANSSASITPLFPVPFRPATTKDF